MSTADGESVVKVLIAILLLAVGVLALTIYNGTPHYGPTSTCAPITIFSHDYTIAADCRIISVLELVAATVSFIFAVFLVLLARPHRQRRL